MPPKVQILSFRHTKFSKHTCLGSQCSPTRFTPLPTGNPGSATDFDVNVGILIPHFQALTINELKGQVYCGSANATVDAIEW